MPYNPRPRPVDQLAVRGEDYEQVCRELEDIKVRGDFLDGKTLGAAYSETMNRISTGINDILNGHSQKYLASLIDPFSSSAVGTRIPSLNPIDMYTYVQFDSFALNN